MGEFRKDYILDRWVVISPKRGSRPHELDKPNSSEIKTCFFCPNAEKETPSEIGRVPLNGSWKIRWFENKFAAVHPETYAQVKTDNRFYTFAPGFGYHEVIVETPNHNKQLWDLSKEDVEDVLHIYARRILELESKPNIKYVCVFKNHGYLGGTSIVHSHSQVVALPFVPPTISEKITAMRKFISCPYCAIIESEKNSGKRCFENDQFVAFTPYASRFNYELWIFPKQHIARFEDLKFASLAELVLRALKKLKSANYDYNLLISYGPKGDDFHVHVEICPRIALWAGFELDSGVVINSVSPEDAAAWYRGEE